MTVYRGTGQRFEGEVDEGREGAIALPEVGMDLKLGELYREIE